MDNILLSMLHSIQVEILDEIVRICDSNRLDYFLIGGTLLGAIANSGRKSTSPRKGTGYQPGTTRLLSNAPSTRN